MASHSELDRPTRDEREFQISLGEIWALVIKRKRLLLSIVALSLSVCAILVLLRPGQVSCVSTMRIGVIPIGEPTRLELVEAPETLTARLNEIVIPSAIGRYLSEHPSSGSFEIVATVLGKGTLLKLEGHSRESLGPALHAIQTNVLVQIERDHHEQLAATRAYFGAEMTRLDNMMKAQRKHRELTVKRLDQIEKSLAAHPNPTGNLALSALMVNSLLTDAQNQLESNELREAWVARMMKTIRDSEVVTAPTLTTIGGPQWARRLSIAALLGVFVGFVVCFLIEYRAVFRTFASPPLVARET